METDIFLISVYGLHARGIQAPNAMIGMLIFFGGVCQFLAGIMEFITGNTVRTLLSFISLPLLPHKQN
jgi:succinate-acetate transporter protein